MTADYDIHFKGPATGFITIEAESMAEAEKEFLEQYYCDPAVLTNYAGFRERMIKVTEILRADGSNVEVWKPKKFKKFIYTVTWNDGNGSYGTVVYRNSPSALRGAIGFIAEHVGGAWDEYDIDDVTKLRTLIEQGKLAEAVDYWSGTMSSLGIEVRKCQAHSDEPVPDMRWPNAAEEEEDE